MGPPFHCEKCGALYDETNHVCEIATSNSNHLNAFQPIWSFSGLRASASDFKARVSTAYAVTYWVTIESGDTKFHIPVDSSNVSGSENAIIEGSTGMKKVWKWVQEKGLSDKVSLQDAFDLAKDMHGENEDENSFVEGLKSVRSISRASGPQLSATHQGRTDQPVLHLWGCDESPCQWDP